LLTALAAAPSSAARAHPAKANKAREYNLIR
jgi:hypothetical protein